MTHLLTALQPRSQAARRHTRLGRPMGLLALLTGLVIGLGGCVVAPVPGNRPVVVNPGPVYVAPPPATVYVAPAYPSPGIGWVWVQHPRYGWGWHHPEYGWHRGWR